MKLISKIAATALAAALVVPAAFAATHGTLGTTHHVAAMKTMKKKVMMKKTSGKKAMMHKKMAGKKMTKKASSKKMAKKAK
jgi:hypothetical protein